jgi:D-amino peptidase
MRVFIVADLEGCSGVVAGPDESRDGAAMTEDINAVVCGAFDGGATTVVVRDFHCSGRNISPDSNDPRATLIRGSAIPQGGAEFDSSYDYLFLIGFHPPTGDPEGVSCHTFDEGYALSLNGVEMGEAELLAALAGAEGLSVGLVSGDSHFVERFKTLMPEVRAVVTKRPLSLSSAECRSPSFVHEELRECARCVVSSQEKLPLLVMERPYRLEVGLPSTQHALVAEWIPQVQRTGPKQVRFEGHDLRQVFKLVYLLVGLSSIIGDWR